MISHGFGQVLLTAVALGCDAFSVALCIGSNKRYPGQRFRLGFHFGLFQTLMFLLGNGIGRVVLDLVRTWDHWIAFLLVGYVAVHMLYEAFHHNENRERRDFSRGWYLVSLSVATSIDALAVGFAFSFLGGLPFLPGLIIGIVAALMTLAGLLLGRRLRSSWGQWAEIAGGLVLIVIAIKLFYI